jgi:hypothetical protein
MLSLVCIASVVGAAMKELLSPLFAFAEADENEPTSSGKAISELIVLMLVATGFVRRVNFWSFSESGTKLRVLSFSSVFTISSKRGRLAGVRQARHYLRRIAIFSTKIDILK